MQNFSLFILLVSGAALFLIIIESEIFKLKQAKPDFEDSWFLNWVNSLPDKHKSFLLNTEKLLHTTNQRFLSFSIDASQVHRGFINPSLKDPILRKTVSHLSGGYLRLGGRATDQIYFNPAQRAWPDKYLPLDGGECSFDNKSCPSVPTLRKFSMSALDWMQINEFVQATGMKLLFDFNVLMRNNETWETWDSSNAELLLDFSFAHHYQVDWGLGNEPNSFKHVFGVEVPPFNLAGDFGILKKLLMRYAIYNSSVLAGPDITNPRHLSSPSPVYLEEYLFGEPMIDAITWHHYYLNPSATLGDFLDPSTYDGFTKNCRIIATIVKESPCSQKPIWLGETGSAYGGGVANLSDKFVSSFLWLDKLGTAAREGISLVVRQSLYRGHYSLLDEHSLDPNPDFWVSVLYKMLVGHEVLNITNVNEHDDGTLRVYAHCSTDAKIVLFGVNIGNVTQGINMAMNVTAEFYSLNGSPTLMSRLVNLNGKRLHLSSEKDLPKFTPIVIFLMDPVSIPPLSIFFLHLNLKNTLCDKFGTRPNPSTT